MVPSVEHECALTAIVTEQASRITALEQELALMKKLAFSRKSEKSKKSGKMPSVASTLPKDPLSEEERIANRQATRDAKAAERREKMATVVVEHTVLDSDKQCTSCGGDKFAPLGAGKVTTVIEWIPGRLVQYEHVQEVLRCTCGSCVLTAAGAPKVIEGGRYGASFLAHLVVEKCVDHTPFYRIEKEFKRQDLSLSRSTMNALFHRTASMLKPVSDALLKNICARPIVQADETRLRMQNGGDGKAKDGYIWTFVAKANDGGIDTAYVFADNRSSKTPLAMLGNTQGVLVADAYSGYNAVSGDDGRERAGCYAHVRRKFFDALDTAPSAQQPIDLILELYIIEHEAKQRDIVGTPEHLAIRTQQSSLVRDKLKAWLDANLDLHPPKSAIAKAIGYALNTWDCLGVFLKDPDIPLDNNPSERALRRVALGRKNFLFVGDLEAGKNIAGLYSIVATCELRNINPYEYLCDVLMRVNDHPASKIDELLPGNWFSMRNQAVTEIDA